MTGLVSTLPQGVVRSSSTVPLTIPANNVPLTISAFGTKFYIVESDTSDLLYIKTNHTPEELFSVGTGKEFPEERYFARLEIRNPTTAPITITLFYGFGDYIDRRTTIVGNRLSSIVPTRDSVSKTLAGGSTTIGATTTVSLPGTASGIYLQRKCLIVSNLDAAITLYVRDSLGNNACAIFPLNSVCIFDSGALQIRNDAGASVQYCYSEVWYIKPS